MNVWSADRFGLALICGAAFWELPDPWDLPRVPQWNQPPAEPAEER